ncbi:hypothetical protein J1N35_039980 [Gossypium stocksii]|uniref:Secreted protein n=1 Tax=Gossypium stocksii TaxID=47602 RepID=A0A9D3UCU3_9ROSI|nr:hypothetical protein J1N35_039980 [Gossypium stocksii]
MITNLTVHAFPGLILLILFRTTSAAREIILKHTVKEGRPTYPFITSLQCKVLYGRRVDFKVKSYCPRMRAAEHVWKTAIVRQHSSRMGFAGNKSFHSGIFYERLMPK